MRFIARMLYAASPSLSLSLRRFPGGLAGSPPLPRSLNPGEENPHLPPPAGTRRADENVGGGGGVVVFDSVRRAERVLSVRASGGDGGAGDGKEVCEFAAEGGRGCFHVHRIPRMSHRTCPLCQDWLTSRQGGKGGIKRERKL